MNDLISRQAAIDALKRAEALTRAFGYHHVIETIKELPTADLSEFCDQLWKIAYERGKAEACQSARRAEAVEIPPHGRLIDADELAGLCDIMADKCGGIGESIWGQFRATVEDAPTIIEAEGVNNG